MYTHCLFRALCEMEKHLNSMLPFSADTPLLTQFQVMQFQAFVIFLQNNIRVNEILLLLSFRYMQFLIVNVYFLCLQYISCVCMHVRVCAICVFVRVHALVFVSMCMHAMCVFVTAHPLLCVHTHVPVCVHVSCICICNVCACACACTHVCGLPCTEFHLVQGLMTCK